MDLLFNFSQMKEALGAKILHTVESIEHVLDPYKIGSPQYSKTAQNNDVFTRRADVYKELLIESQIQHITMLNRLPERLVDNKENVPQSSDSLDLVKSDSSQETDQLLSYLKRTIEEKTEALSEYKLAKENTFLLQKEMKELKSKIRDQDKRILQLIKLSELIESGDNVADNLAVEYSLLSGDFEKKCEQVRILDKNISQLEAEVFKLQRYSKTLESSLRSASSESLNHNISTLNYVGDYIEFIEKIETNFKKQMLILHEKTKDLVLTSSPARSSSTDLSVATFVTPPKPLQERSKEFSSEAIKLKSIIEKLEADKLSLEAEVNLYKERSVTIENLNVESKCEIEKLNASIEYYKNLYLKEVFRRRSLNAELNDLRGNIKVFCRVRPLLDFEVQEQSYNKEATIKAISETEIEFIGSLTSDSAGNSTKYFEFYKVFNPVSTEQEIFQNVKPLIEDSLDGFDICLFAYGQTGSGKTYTMNTIVANSLDSIFSNNRESNNLEVNLSIFEIYNESIFDLLSSRTDKHKSLEIRLSDQAKIFIPGLTVSNSKTLQEALDCITHAQHLRKVGSHNLNENSSRSHLIIKVQISSTNAAMMKTSSNLYLIDLAGSERVSKTETTGNTLKEAQYINKSLSSLGDVMHGLQSKKSHVPFRNSKLTFLLQDCLKPGSGGKVGMFVTLSPAKVNAKESLCTLKFAERVSTVELGQAVKRNQNMQQ